MLGSGAAMLGRGAAMLGRGAAMLGRGAAMLGRGAAMLGRGAAMLSRGAAMLGRGAACCAPTRTTMPLEKPTNRQLAASRVHLSMRIGAQTIELIKGRSLRHLQPFFSPPIRPSTPRRRDELRQLAIARAVAQRLT